jgi:hypothetical protein
LVAVDRQLRHPDPARGRVQAPAAQDLHQLSLETALGGAPDPAAHHVSDQGMTEARVERRPVPHETDQAPGLGGVNSFLAGEFGQRVDVEGFGQRQQLERIDHTRTGLIQAALQQRGQPGRHRGGAAQLPHAVDPVEGARVDRPFDQVAQEQWVAAGGFPHQVRGQALETATDHRFDQGDALLLGKWL